MLALLLGPALVVGNLLGPVTVALAGLVGKVGSGLEAGAFFMLMGLSHCDGPVRVFEEVYLLGGGVGLFDPSSIYLLL